MLTTVLIVLGICLLVAGLVGAFLPVLPGPPLSWLGLLCVFLIQGIPFQWGWLMSTFVVMVAITVLDFVLPAIGAKKYGGSKAGVWGSVMGMILGLVIFPPFGIFVGAFLGAFVAELFISKTSINQASHIAWGALIGFITSSMMKFLVSFAFLIIFLYKLWEFRAILF